MGCCELPKRKKHPSAVIGVTLATLPSSQELDVRTGIFWVRWQGRLRRLRDGIRRRALYLDNDDGEGLVVNVLYTCKSGGGEVGSSSPHQRVSFSRHDPQVLDFVFCVRRCKNFAALSTPLIKTRFLLGNHRRKHRNREDFWWIGRGFFLWCFMI